jgi:hypothetical protein
VMVEKKWVKGVVVGIRMGPTIPPYLHLTAVHRSDRSCTHPVVERGAAGQPAARHHAGGRRGGGLEVEEGAAAVEGGGEETARHRHAD